MVYFSSFVRQKPEVYDVRLDTSMLPVMVNWWLTIITAIRPYAAGASSCYVPDLSLATKLLWCAVFCSTVKQYQRDKKLPPFLSYFVSKNLQYQRLPLLNQYIGQSWDKLKCLCQKNLTNFFCVLIPPWKTLYN